MAPIQETNRRHLIYPYENEFIGPIDKPTWGKIRAIIREEMPTLSGHQDYGLGGKFEVFQTPKENEPCISYYPETGVFHAGNIPDGKLKAFIRGLK